MDQAKMLRVLLCITCCSAPPSRRPSRTKVDLERKSEKPVEKVDFKSLVTLGRDVKGNLLDDDDQDAIQEVDSTSDNEKEGVLQNALKVVTNGLREVEHLVDEADSFTASTSTYVQNIVSSSSQTYLEKQQERFERAYDDQSVSSLEISPYKENPATEDEEETKENQNDADDATIQGEDIETADDGPSNAGMFEIRSKVNIPSITKIGDYARIEYSPVDDLDSLTTFSQSRGGSERGARLTSISRSNSLGRQVSPSRTSSANISRSSSRGIESTSISISSELSNEQLQQNLTNILETANSPSLFGTIGLPLGPPVDGNLSETARTTPETTGAALTSASQDSLSETSLGDQLTNRFASTTTRASTPGAALVAESSDKGYFDESGVGDVPGLPMGSPDRDLNQSDITIGVGEKSIERVESPQPSISASLTNPTPTPSEMSGSSSKKKLKLKPKSLLKKLRPGSKKKSKDDGN